MWLRHTVAWYRCTTLNKKALHIGIKRLCWGISKKGPQIEDKDLLILPCVTNNRGLNFPGIFLAQYQKDAAYFVTWYTNITFDPLLGSASLNYSLIISFPGKAAAGHRSGCKKRHFTGKCAMLWRAQWVQPAGSTRSVWYVVLVVDNGYISQEVLNQAFKSHASFCVCLSAVYLAVHTHPPPPLLSLPAPSLSAVSLCLPVSLPLSVCLSVCLSLSLSDLSPPLSLGLLIFLYWYISSETR